MKFLLLPLFFLNTIGISWSQSVNNDSLLLLKPLHSISISATNLMYRYEHPIANNQILIAEAGLGANLVYRKDITEEYRWGTSIYPELGIGYRNHYNIERRALKEKKTGLNSSNYYGVNALITPFNRIYTSKYYDTELNTHYEFSIVWGLRRQLGEKFVFDFNLGPKISNNTFKKDANSNIIDINWRFFYCF